MKMKMKRILLTFAAMMLLSTNVMAQGYLGIYSNFGLLQNLFLANTNGPAQQVGDTSNTVIFADSTTQTTDAGIRVSAAYSNQQYIVTGVGVGDPAVVQDHPSMMFGAGSNDTEKVLYPPQFLLVPMTNVATPSSTYYSPTPFLIGTGLAPADTFAFEHYVSTEALLQEQLANQLPTDPYNANGSFEMGLLTYTFSDPVDYPILHVTGLGGYVTTDYPDALYTNVFSVDLELVAGAATSMTRLSGTSFTVLDGGTRIKNEFNYQDIVQNGGSTGTNGDEGGSGSFIVNGTAITTVTFKVYIVGKNTIDGSPTPSLWSSVPGAPMATLQKYSGDRFNTTWTLPLDDPTAVTIGSVDLQALSTEAFLDSLGAGQMDNATLLALLQAWDPDLATTLADASRDEILLALQQYLDPDGDGQVAVLHWDTLEERGTIGFYVERLEDAGAWQRVNARMLPGLITAPMGGEYLLVDPGAQSGHIYQYRLIEQEARGATRAYGPYTLEMP